MFSAAETLAKEPLVKKDGLKGGGYYVEYRTDDARLTIEVMKQAVEKGATPLNYSKVKNLIYKNGIVVGVLVEDLLTGEEYEVHAKKVVNATGPWSMASVKWMIQKKEKPSSCQKVFISSSINHASRLSRRFISIHQMAGWSSRFRAMAKPMLARPILFTMKTQSTLA